jgi:L,D-transpeptidase YcfS
MEMKYILKLLLLSIIITTTYANNNINIENNKNLDLKLEEHNNVNKILINVDYSKNILYLINNETNETIKEYKVSTAKKNLPRPQGKGKITKIELDPNWYPTKKTRDYFKKKKGITLPMVVNSNHPLNYMGKIKISLNHIVNGNQIYRIHGTIDERTIGSYESGGCIRMKNNEGIELAKFLKEIEKKHGLKNIIVNL